MDADTADRTTRSDRLDTAVSSPAQSVSLETTQQQWRESHDDCHPLGQIPLVHFHRASLSHAEDTGSQTSWQLQKSTLMEPMKCINNLLDFVPISKQQYSFYVGCHNYTNNFWLVIYA